MIVYNTVTIVIIDFHQKKKICIVFVDIECAKFRGSRAIMGLVGFVPPCHRAFVGPKIFLVGISWVLYFFSWVFHGSKILWYSVNFSKKLTGTYD